MLVQRVLGAKLVKWWNMHLITLKYWLKYGSDFTNCLVWGKVLNWEIFKLKDWATFRNLRYYSSYFRFGILDMPQEKLKLFNICTCHVWIIYMWLHERAVSYDVWLETVLWQRCQWMELKKQFFFKFTISRFKLETRRRTYFIFVYLEFASFKMGGGGGRQYQGYMIFSGLQVQSQVRLPSEVFLIVIFIFLSKMREIDISILGSWPYDVDHLCNSNTLTTQTRLQQQFCS